MTIISSRQDVSNSSVSSHLPAIGHKVLSAAVLAVMFALIKTLGGEYPVGQIVFVRPRSTRVFAPDGRGSRVTNEPEVA